MKLLHIYQNTLDGMLLFYTATDFLVYFSIICTASRKHDVKLIGICPMYDHLHNLAQADSRNRVSAFVRDYTRDYSIALNTSFGNRGQIFNHTFGCAVKTGDKAIRTACSYLYNNPCEKGLCIRAEYYRWSFLAYAESANPFSERIRLNIASMPLRGALKEIDAFRKQGKNLNHALLNRLFSMLSRVEKNQLTDYIITQYNCIDYKALISLYGSYDKMCLAFASNQGSEYEINEVFEPGGHKIYPAISAALINDFGFGSVKDALRQSDDKKRDLVRQLKFMTGAQEWQLRKYFRL